MNQTDMVLEYMRDTGSITAMEAVEEFGCYRLSARIADLRKRGIEIQSETVTRKNRYGKSVTFSRYRLEN